MSGGGKSIRSVGHGLRVCPCSMVFHIGTPTACRLFACCAPCPPDARVVDVDGPAQGPDGKARPVRPPAQSRDGVHVLNVADPGFFPSSSPRCDGWSCDTSVGRRMIVFCMGCRDNYIVAVVVAVIARSCRRQNAIDAVASLEDQQGELHSLSTAVLVRRSKHKFLCTRNIEAEPNVSS